jgi:hypothetical protein
MGSMRRAVAAGCAALALLALPAAASAEVRSGHASDPSGDSAGALSQDIVGAVVHYDTNGGLAVSATLASAVTSVPRSWFKASLASYTSPGQCAGAGVTLSGYSDSKYTTATLGSGNLIERQGLAITFNASGSALRSLALSCLTLTVTDSGGTVVDALDVPLYFDGSGPDGDGDGVVDNVDQCPAQPGPAPAGCVPDSDGDGVVDAADQCPGVFGSPPTGCPGSTAPLPGPPGIVTTLPAEPTPAPKSKPCTAVSLKGKSLAAARTALTKAGCKLGKVTKPKKVKKGAKLVVVKQSGKNPVAITLAAAKRK